MKNATMIVDGKPAESDTRRDAVNPYTGEVWATFPEATHEDVDRAVNAARRAFQGGWSSSSGAERARLMHALADRLESEADAMARMESTDNGKVIRETRNQMGFAARNLRFFAGYADKLYGRTIPLDNPGLFDFTRRRPHGVAALITAWNSPIALLANKLPPALAAGNTVVVKPSEHASVTTCEFGRMAIDAGLPPGVVNVVTGGPEVGDALVGHPGIDKISFTGGTPTGARIAESAGRRLVPVTLELGGKSPNIVFDDADLDRAVVGAVAGIFAAAGQTCIAGSRLLVQRSVYPEVVDAITKRAAAIRLGDPLDASTEMGPVANRPQFERIVKLIEKGKQEGATLLTGGGPATGPDLADGLFIAPTVFGEVSPGMRIASEEVFGPVLSVIPFDGEEEAVEIANGVEYGLAAAVWSRDIERVHRVVDRLEAGSVWVNTYRTNAAQAPFGGIKSSGYGRERGEEALAEYTFVQNVMVDYSGAARDPFSIKT
ncbi:aldehyde dehydrogenase [Streptomyces marispadix]|uniref:Aldehyde dehydrogenase n=1 Tax=Streptomyces marispadix TaxID=2922868 RepID=A0ABS9T5J5_9ACTN|nr:aldehyde dehydrogenase [Streptomyces marispadix]MCH6163818.1 aldehyde dehydrogenase [Streptomyces marispadix]